MSGYKYTIRDEVSNPASGRTEITERQVDPMEASNWGAQYSELRPQAIQYGMLGRGDQGRDYFIVSYTNPNIPEAGNRIQVALTSNCTNGWLGFVGLSAERKAIEQLNNKQVNGGVFTVITSENGILDYIRGLNAKTVEKVLSVSGTVLEFGELADKKMALIELKRLNFDMQSAIAGITKVANSTYKNSQAVWKQEIEAIKNTQTIINDAIKSFPDTN